LGSNTEYFATLDQDSLVQELCERINNWNRYIQRQGLANKWRKSYDMYFGKHLGEDGATGTSNVELAGDDGELTAIGVNHFRNLIKHVLAITTDQKPAYDPRATNTDLESMQQAELAKNILDFYLVEKRMFRDMKLAAERAIALSKGYVYMRWDPALGKQFGVQPVSGPDGQPVMDSDGQPQMKVLYEGDAAVDAASPWDVMYDYRVRQYKNHKWNVIRTYRNKFDLAARYPALADKIVQLDGNDMLMSTAVMPFTPLDTEEDAACDIIPVYEFYHLRTDAVPNGRYTLFLTPEIIPYDGPYQYRDRLPIFRITPGEIFETGEGYTDAFDILVLQQVYDVLVSTAFTNQQAFGTQAIWFPDGVNVSAEQLGKGLAVLKGGQPNMKPEVLQLCATPKEIFENQALIESMMEKLMGVNSVVRGDPGHGLKSGVALGRLQALAIQYSSNFQQSWGELQEDCGTFLLNILQDFAKTDRMVAIAGKTNKGAMAAFNGDKINQIQRVVIDLGNPLSRTVAGRMDMADTLLGKGLIKDGRAYINLIETGQFDQALEGEEAREMLVRKENEDLRDGKPVMAMVGDPHLFHIQEHLAVLADPMIRGAQAQGDPLAMKITQATTNHMQEHYDIYHKQDPVWSTVVGEPPAPPPPMMMGPGGPPPPNGPPPGPPPGAPMGGHPGPMPNGPQGTMGHSPNHKMPGVPKEMMPPPGSNGPPGPPPIPPIGPLPPIPHAGPMNVGPR
jgi:hypothetical protein